MFAAVSILLLFINFASMIFLFVGWHFNFRNYKVRRSWKKWHSLQNVPCVHLSIKIIPDIVMKFYVNWLELLDKSYFYTTFSDDFHAVMVRFLGVGSTSFFSKSKCSGKCNRTLKKWKALIQKINVLLTMTSVQRMMSFDSLPIKNE